MNIVSKTWNRIPPKFRGIVLFVIVLFASNYFWEFTVRGDEDGGPLFVTFLGMDISGLFRWAVLSFANVVHNVLGLLGFPTYLVNASVYHPNGNAVNIIAGCTAIKQMFIMFCILLFARGPWRHKLWYVLLSMLLIVGFNIFRLTFLAWLVIDYREMFDFFHVRVMKYLFYAFIFAIWIVWDEVLRPRLSR